jgi:aspartate/methionine/tyrosine aminotransferase
MAGADAAARSFVLRSVADLPRVGSRVTDERAADLASGGGEVLDLHAHPQRPLPPHVLEAVIAAARENRTVPSRGLPALRRAIAECLSAELGTSVDAEREVLVTAGAMQALDLVFRATAAGAPVITPEPCFFLHGLVSQLVTVTTRAEDGYAIDWRALERAITPATRVLLIVTPGNPTGYVLTEEDVDRLVGVAERHDLLVVSDESYDRLVYEGREHRSPLAAPGLRTRGVLIRSFTKSFAMPGWRVGYLVGPQPLIDACLKLFEWSALYGTSVSQCAALAALSGPLSWLEGITGEFESHRDRVHACLTRAGVPTVLPAGGPFLFPDISSLGADDEIAHRWLHDFGIPVSSGKLLRGPGHLRLPLGGSEETLQRLEAAIPHAVGTVLAG